MDIGKGLGPGDAAAARARRNTGRRLKGALAVRIGTDILSGVYLPGDRLSGEIAFAEELDVSRTAYREAVQVLAAKGLVESRTKTGTRILPRERWNLLDPDVLAWSFAGEPDPQLIHNLFELRAIIEPAAARLAAERREADDLAVLSNALAAMELHSLATETGRAADRTFHRALLHATRNDALIFLSAGVGAAVHWTTEFKQRARALPRDPVPDHRRVYEAVAAGDSLAAGTAMQLLIELALEDTIRNAPQSDVADRDVFRAHGEHSNTSFL
jgi:DNA-binding FadR family transcriptional regulator